MALPATVPQSCCFTAIYFEGLLRQEAIVANANAIKTNRRNSFFITDKHIEVKECIINVYCTLIIIVKITLIIEIKKFILVH